MQVNVRLDEERLYLLVLIGVRADDRKELITLADGYRESEGSRADREATVVLVGDTGIEPVTSSV